MNNDLFEFIDGNLASSSGRICAIKLLKDPKLIEQIKRRCTTLNHFIVDLRLNKVGALCAQKSCLLFDGIVYKFGQSTRHQKFWKNAQQIFAQLKRINRRNLLDYLNNFVNTLQKSGHLYAPSNSAMFYLGSLILERIVLLDRLRIYCFHTADAAMGYVDLKHLLTFNLMLIAIASDVAREAAHQIHHLQRLYDSLADWLRLYSHRFPSSSNQLTLKSMKEEYLNPMRTQKLEEVRSIIRLLNLNELEYQLESDDFDVRLQNVNDVIMKSLARTDRSTKKGPSCRLIERRQERAT